MYVETPEDLAEFLANTTGVYGAHDERCDLKVHVCRSCYVSAMTARIRQSVANEQVLRQMEAVSQPSAPHPRPRWWHW